MPFLSALLPARRLSVAGSLVPLRHSAVAAPCSAAAVLAAESCLPS